MELPTRNGKRFRKKKKIKARKPNSDGLVNWLPLPRLPRYQPLKSMRECLNPLFKTLPPGLFTTSGTESVGLRADAQGVMVFAIPSRLFHRAPGLTILTRTCIVGQLHRDPGLFSRLPGLCKNHATATQTPTNQTAGPLGCNYVVRHEVALYNCQLISYMINFNNTS